MKTQKLYDEQELLRRLKSSDHSAFERIFHRYKSKMAQNALRLLKSPELAEDLLQELFIKLWEQREKIDLEKSLFSYLYKIATNLAYDYFRKAQRDYKLRNSLIDTISLVHEPIEKYILGKESKAAIENALSHLPEQQRKVFTLCKIEERSYQEVAELLQISIGTVNNHLTRANASLRKQLLKKSSISTHLLAVMILFK